MKDLIPRTITAVVAIAIVVATLLVGALWRSIWPVALLGAFVVGVASWEYLQLLERNGIFLNRLAFVSSAVLVILAYGTPEAAFGDLVLWAALVFPIALYLFDPDALRKILATMGGIIYIPYLLHFIYPLYRVEGGAVYGLLALALVWGYDIGAYLAGLSVGKESISPNDQPAQELGGRRWGVCALAGCSSPRADLEGLVDLHAAHDRSCRDHECTDAVGRSPRVTFETLRARQRCRGPDARPRRALGSHRRAIVSSPCDLFLLSVRAPMGLTMDTKIILSVEGVHKSFDGTKAVEDVSFEVQKGEIFGLLGPNGAGKTTLIRMILGIFQPDSGEIRFSFSPEGRLLPRQRVGYLPEERGLYDNRKVCDTLVFLASLKGMDARLARERAFLWLQRLQLERYFHRPIRELSKGMQQKIQFIAAILHEPDFVILDEPFAGLDPVNQDVFRELIRELKARGTTILLSAHQMHLVEDLVDRIFLINKGRQILYGELREIKRNWKEDWVTLVFRGDGEILKNSPLVKSAQIEDGRAQLTLREGVRPEEFFAEISGKIEIEEIAIRKPPLHHIFVELVTSPLAPPRHGEGETSTLTPSPSPLRGRGEQRGEGEGVGG
jgi:ABC-2 type transport system ATP-binding protein